MNPIKLIQKSKDSSFYLWLLNTGLNRMIPFNQPHGFRILQIETGSIKVKLPFKRKNQNHIKGIHACAMATLAEYATGLTLISCLDPQAYRIIMQKIQMEYYYQGKKDAFATFSITDSWLKENVLDIVESGTPVIVPCIIDIHDIDNNKLATGNISWQIKAWKDVKTKA